MSYYHQNCILRPMSHGLFYKDKNILQMEIVFMVPAFSSYCKATSSCI